MPYLHPGEMPRKMLDGTISWAAIEREYAIVPDTTQFEPAQSLWIKIANDPNYVVRIADVDTGFFPDENGQDIAY